MRVIASVALIVMALTACGKSGKPGTTDAAPPAADTAQGAVAVASPAPTYPERAWFGDTHVHTGWSADAGMDGAIMTPEDAFRFARGDEVMSNTGLPARLARPLDWMVITDHSDGMGTINEILGGSADMMADPVVKGWSEALNSGDPHRVHTAVMQLIDMQSNGKLPAIVMDPKWMVSAWEKTITIADKYDEPGTFTAMIGYEWTVNVGGGDNLHRNVIYRDAADRARQMLPLTTFQTMDPEGLWKWMAEYESKTGGRVLAIPHNGNLSNGRMFELTRFDGTPMTSEYAAARARWEPLFEVAQIKGQSESHPSLSPTDDFAAWDLWDRGNLTGVPKNPGMIQHEYWRAALKNGLAIEAKLGANPFKYGAQAATDTHTGLATADDDNFYGKFKALEPGPERMTRPVTRPLVGWEQAAAGYTGVWATANTREAIWDALNRRETFGTTGPRLSVRFFGGYDFIDADAMPASLAAAGYAKGVPMGGDLAAAPAGKAPTFLVAAMKDPQGANLDRVQVVKGWMDASGKTHEKVFDVKWAGDRRPGADGRLPPVGSTADIPAATYTNTIGATELVTMWTDPEFDPALPAFYYVRVLEIPTPRWTAHDQLRFKVQAPRGATLVQQERAITSPIWYTPKRG